MNILQTRPKLVTAVLLFIAIQLVACSFQHTQSLVTTEVTKQQTILDKKHKINSVLTMPLSGLFIGVSNYQEEAQVQPTMAHTISASLMYSFLNDLSYVGQSSNNTDKDLFTEHTMKSGDTNLTLLADLRAQPEKDKQDIFNLQGALASISGVINDYDPSWNELNSDGTFSYVGKGQLVTKKRILDSLSDHLNNYVKYVSKNNKEMLLYLYVSAHGVTIKDEGAYIVPADGRLNDSKTLISYRELLRQIYDAQEELLKNERLSVIPQIIVILDTCRNTVDGEVVRNLEANKKYALPPPGVSVLLSTSPGQYSYHLKNLQRVQYNVTESKFSGIYFGASPNRPPAKGKYSLEFSSKISALPVATIAGFNKILEEYEKNIDEYLAYENKIKQLKESLSPQDFFAEMMMISSENQDQPIKYSIPRNKWLFTKDQLLRISEDALPQLLSLIESPKEMQQTVQQTLQRLDAEIFVNTDLIILNK